MNVVCESCGRGVELDRDATFRRVVQRKVFCQTADLELPLRPGRVEGTVVFAERPSAEVQAAIAKLKADEGVAGGDSLSLGSAARVRQALQTLSFVSAGAGAVVFAASLVFEVGLLVKMLLFVLFSFATYAFKKSR